MKILLGVITLCLLVIGSAKAQEITFEASVTTGIETVTPELTWSTDPVADSCVAGGDWAGNKGPSGNEILPSITSSATYNLTCDWTSNSAVLSWAAPTQNTDGSNYTDPAGYRIYKSTTSGDYSSPDMVEIANPSVTTFVIAPLTQGTWFFVSTAYNQNGVESDHSNEASKLVGTIGVSEFVGITVNPKPVSPGTLTAQ